MVAPFDGVKRAYPFPKLPLRCGNASRHEVIITGRAPRRRRGSCHSRRTRCANEGAAPPGMRARTVSSG